MPKADSANQAQRFFEYSGRVVTLFPWVVLSLWVIVLFAGLSLAPQLWLSVRSAFPVPATLLPWGVLLFGFLLLGGAMIRSASVPRGRLLLLTGGWGLAFGWCTAALSRYPVEPLHAAEYVVLALLARWAFKTTFLGSRAWAFAFFFAVGVGTMEEVLQLWTPGRVYDTRDLVLNNCAVFFGLLLAACMEYARSGKDVLNTKAEDNPVPGRRGGQIDQE